MGGQLKVGMLARGEDRGLGIQTWEFYRHMHPARTLLIDMGELAGGFTSHPERFPDATRVAFEGGQLPERQVRDWLDGLDVVFTAETFYDWHLCDWAKAAGVATVAQVNPEFYRHAADQLPHPTAWWAPSPWQMHQLPERTRLVPVPVAGDRFPLTAPERGDRLRVLHVAGHRAAGDRNGTLQLLQALRLVRQPMEVKLLTQDSRLPRVRPMGKVSITTEAGGRANYWDLYRDADVLVLPRRYGGLCLPVQEAMACGLAVVMTDCSPNDFWPTLRVKARPRGDLNAGIGRIRMYQADPRSLASTLDQLAADPAALDQHQRASLTWARSHTWEQLRPLYDAELTHVSAMNRGPSRV